MIGFKWTEKTCSSHELYFLIKKFSSCRCFGDKGACFCCLFHCSFEGTCHSWENPQEPLTDSRTGSYTVKSLPMLLKKKILFLLSLHLLDPCRSTDLAWYPKDADGWCYHAFARPLLPVTTTWDRQNEHPCCCMGLLHPHGRVESLCCRIQ